MEHIWEKNMHNWVFDNIKFKPPTVYLLDIKLDMTKR